jgi:peroxiredoxin
MHQSIEKENPAMPEQTIKPGDPAPYFELMDENRNTVKLSDLKGKTVVLLFYPMDFSPVCTQEHCAFGPEITRFAPRSDTVVFGVNCDHPFSHAAFKQQYKIPYSLLSDPTRRMVKAYGMFAGEEPFNCAKRGTVVIDKAGRIAFHQEVPMKEPRKVEDLAKAVAAAG